jgi:membrane-associated phospholipid phosphatase
VRIKYFQTILTLLDNDVDFYVHFHYTFKSILHRKGNEKMTNRGKWNFSAIFMIIAVLIALYTSIKVAIGRTFWMDDNLASLFSHVPASFQPFFINLTAMGDKMVIGIVALIMLAWLLIKERNFVGAAAFALSLALGNEASKFLKNVFARPRPDLEQIVHIKSYSFPSGHAMVGMIVYFFIAYLLIEAIQSKTGKLIVATLAAILLLLIGASRIILHVHYPSDVLGGFALGYIWVTIWILLYNYLKRK